MLIIIKSRETFRPVGMQIVGQRFASLTCDTMLCRILNYWRDPSSINSNNRTTAQIRTPEGDKFDNNFHACLS